MNDSKVLSYLLWGLAFSIPIFLVGISFLSYEIFKSFFDTMTTDGDASRVTRALFELVVIGFRSLAVVLASFMGLYIFFRGQIQPSVEKTPLVQFFLQKLVTWIRTEERAHLAVLGAIFAVGAALRLFYSSMPMRSDEAWTYYHFIDQPFVLTFSLYFTNNHLFHSVLAHLSVNMFGDTLWAFRLPALIASILVIPAIYFLFRRLSGKAAGLLAAALIAPWPMLIDYSSNSRGYSIMMLLTVLLFVAANRMRQENDSFSKFSFGTIAALGLYTIPAFILPLGSAGLWLVFSVLTGNAVGTSWLFIRGLCWTAVGALSLTFLLYLPVFVVSGFDSVFGNPMVVGVTESPLFLAVGSLKWAWKAQWFSNFPITLQLVLGAGFLATAMRTKSFGVPLWLPALVWCAFIISITNVQVPTRVWVFALPIFLGLAATGLSFLPRFSKFDTTVILLVVLIGGAIVAIKSPAYFFKEYGAFPEAEAVALYVSGAIEEDDALVSVFPGRITVDYYGMRHNTLHKLEKARQLGVNGKFNRIFVVLNSGEDSLTNILAVNDKQFGTSLLLNQYKTLHIESIGEASVVTASVISD